MPPLHLSLAIRSYARNFQSPFGERFDFTRRKEKSQTQHRRSYIFSVTPGSRKKRLPVSTAAGGLEATKEISYAVRSGKSLYVFRVVTGKRQSSAISEPTAGIQVGVVGRDGYNYQGTTKRIGRAEENWQTGRLPNSWGLFEAGSVDECFWIGPEINPVEALWLAPEADHGFVSFNTRHGSPLTFDVIVSAAPTAPPPLLLAGKWLVDEARLLICPLEGRVAHHFSDNTQEDEEDQAIYEVWEKESHTDILLSGTLYIFEGKLDPVGADLDSSVLDLKPKVVVENVPLPFRQPDSQTASGLSTPASPKGHTIFRDAVTEALSFGMPDNVSAEEVERKRMAGLKEYSNLKEWLLGATGLLASLGTLGAYALGGEEAAQGFGVGGLIGCLYLYVLEGRVDAIPRLSPTEVAVQNEDEPVRGGVVNKVGRVLLVAAMVACLQGVSWSEIQVHPIQLVCGLLGFLSFKVALLLSVFRQNDHI